MELIYLYIRKYSNKEAGRDKSGIFNIEDKGISFSDNYSCEFTPEKGLIIKEKEKSVYPDFYGENIKSVKLIVGENGTGKTTILDLLGMERDSRFDDHFKTEIRRSKTNNRRYGHTSEEDFSHFTSEYFIVYHLEKNRFVIEFVMDLAKGKKCWIKNLEIDKGKFYKRAIGMVVEYNYEDNIIYFKGYCFDGKNQSVNGSGQLIQKSKISETINLYYFTHKPSHRHSRESFRRNRERDNDGYFLKRVLLKNDVYEPKEYLFVYRFISSEDYKWFRDKMLKFKPVIGLKHNFKSDKYFFDYKDGISKKKKDKYGDNYKALREKLFSLSEGVNQNNKYKYLSRLMVDYLMNTLEAFVDLMHDANQVGSFKESKEMGCMDYSIEKLLAYQNNLYSEVFNHWRFDGKYKIRKDEEFDLDKAENIFVEQKRLMQMIEHIINNKVNKRVDFLEKIINEGKEKNKDSNDNEEEYNLLNKYILIGRYISLRIGKFLNSGTGLKNESNISYQESFEVFLGKLIYLDEQHFINNDIVFKSDDKPNKYSEDIFNIMQDIYKFEDYTISNKIELYIPYASDGERIIINIFSKLVSVLDKEKDLHILIMDEPDQRLHPEWSRQFLNTIIKAINTINNPEDKPAEYKLNAQLIISTHSPFMLSDVREQDVILLNSRENKGNIDNKENQITISSGNFKVFGANIHDILKNEFFLNEKRLMGEFAYEKMKNDFKSFEKSKDEFISNYIKEKEKDNCMVNKKWNMTTCDLKKIEYLIGIIGEPVLKNSLKKEYMIRLKWIDEYERRAESVHVQNLIEEFSILGKKEKRQFIERILKVIDNKGDSK